MNHRTLLSLIAVVALLSLTACAELLPQQLDGVASYGTYGTYYPYGGAYYGGLGFWGGPFGYYSGFYGPGYYGYPYGYYCHRSWGGPSYRQAPFSGGPRQFFRRR
jgi:hypothetical protein